MITNIQIQQILNEEDVEGLLGAGAPPDEYESEARLIAEAFGQAREPRLTEGNLMTVIENTWREMFGPFSEEQLQLRHAAFRRIAQRILAGQQ